MSKPKKKRLINVAVVMGGPSAEHEISLLSGRAMANALNQTKYRVHPIIITSDRRWLSAPHLLTSRTNEKKTKAIIPANEYIAGRLDVALLALHSFGEDGTVQGFFETLGIPYTGPGVLASALAMDKSRFKLFCRSLGIPVLPSMSFDRPTWTAKRHEILRRIKRLGKKIIIKPNASGSSQGITIVSSHDTQSVLTGISDSIKVSQDRVLIEPYIHGRELTVATLGLPGKVKALPVIEIIPTADEFFSYRVKYDGSTREICPAPIPHSLAQLVQRIAVKIHTELGACGVIRTDFMVRGRTPFVLETNTLPGMTPESLVPKAAKSAGIPYPKLLDELIRLALQ